jgi:tetratricopeptide (TPR) repeat protein
MELMAVAFRCKAHIAQGDHAGGLAVIQDGMTKARDRDNKFFIGRLENTVGWVHQELGDFAGALEHDRLSAEIGKQIKNGNVEISALINEGFDHLHLGEPAKALTQLEETQRRAEAGFGAHRWRWAIHVAAYLAETLIALGRPDEALKEIERSLAGALATGSQKYVAKAHLLRGEIALGAGQPAEAEKYFAEGLDTARRIGHPTLIWQCAHARSRSLAPGAPRNAAPRDAAQKAYEMAQLAASTIESIASRLTDPHLHKSFMSWTRVQAVSDHLDHLRRG